MDIADVANSEAKSLTVSLTAAHISEANEEDSYEKYNYYKSNYACRQG